MQPALLIRLRPTGPWRYGPSDGGHDRTDTLFRSDRLFSALTLAAKQLGFLDEWLDATARGGSPRFTLSSLFPFQADTLYAPPPATLWPPPASLVTSPSPVFLSKIRWTAAKFVPVTLIESILLSQKVLADQWAPDPESACLLRRDRPSTSPFRSVIRTGSMVDRLSQAGSIAHTSACVEFEAGAGLWTVIRFQNDVSSSEWQERVEACFRLLGDTGFGGRRTAGWGQSQPPEFQRASWPHVLMPKLGRLFDRNGSDNKSESHWLLSLFSPSAGDQVDWSRGDYAIVERGGFTDVSTLSVAQKKRVRMVAEGSVVASAQSLQGSAVDVAPEGFAHPVFRSGLALALNLPIWQEPQSDERIDGPVETPSDPDALDARPCDEPATPESESRTETEAELELELNSEPPEPETEREAEPESEQQLELEGGPLPEPEAEPHAEAEPQPEPEVDRRPATEEPADEL